RVAIVASLLGWIQDPNVDYAKFAIIINAFLHAPKRIFRRENLNACQWRFREYLFYRFVERDQANIGHAEFCGRNTNPLFGEDFNIPFTLVLTKPENQGCLYGSVVMFTHITLLNPPIHKVAVRA